MTKDLQIDTEFSVIHVDNYYGNYNTLISIDKNCVCVNTDVDIQGVNILSEIDELKNKITQLEQTIKNLENKKID